ncbi:MAG TPA: hypothetical protein PKA06_00010 [Gemmatales bacterium]|nr:hypothetical protein [Gemmatales bacterium]
MLIALLLLFHPNFQERAEYTTLPAEWHGTWQGKLKITNGQNKSEVPFQLLIQSISESRVKWQITYGEGEKARHRNYELAAIPNQPGLFEMDEKTGVRMQERLFGNRLYCLFRVSKTLLHVKHELEGDVIRYEISTFAEKDPLKTQPEGNSQLRVDSWKLLSVQSAELKRVK